MTRVLRLVVVFYIVCQLFKLVPDVYETMFCRWVVQSKHWVTLVHHSA